jgi:glycosyltransferase involved in cell wall biosynthesis
MEPLTLVIPTFNEAETIGGVIREIPVAYRLDIIVADGGSTDGTQAVAQAAGARVIDAGRGYGRACALGGGGRASQKHCHCLHARRRRRPGWFDRRDRAVGA